MARSAIPKRFEYDLNLSLVNISQPKPQTMYMKKVMNVRMAFGSKLLSSFLMSTIYSFSSAYTDGPREAMVMLNINNSGVECLGAIHFSTFGHPCWLSTHTLGTTGLDQLTNRCDNLRREVFFNFSVGP